MKLSVVGVNRRDHLHGWHLIMYDEQGLGPLNIFQTPFLIYWEIILFYFYSESILPFPEERF
jgi:hypothetical protein